MSTHATETEDRTHYEQTARSEAEAGQSLRTRAARVADAAAERDTLGTAAMLAGGSLVASTLRSRSGQRRRARGVAGLALLGLGVVQRLAPAALPVGGERAGRERTAGENSRGTAEENPRGTGDEPPVETRTSPEDGRIQFTEHRDEPRRKPEADEGPHDPRTDDERGAVTVDLSRAALADEVSEATGPAPEQSMPTQTEATEPDRSPPEDASHEATDTPVPAAWSGNASGESTGQLLDAAGADVVSPVDDRETEDSRGEEGADEREPESTFEPGAEVHPDDAEAIDAEEDADGGGDDVVDGGDDEADATDEDDGTVARSAGEVHPDDAEAMDAGEDADAIDDEEDAAGGGDDVVDGGDDAVSGGDDAVSGGGDAAGDETDRSADGATEEE